MFLDLKNIFMKVLKKMHNNVASKSLSVVCTLNPLNSYLMSSTHNHNSQIGGS